MSSEKQSALGEKIQNAMKDDKDPLVEESQSSNTQATKEPADAEKLEKVEQAEDKKVEKLEKEAQPTG